MICRWVGKHPVYTTGHQYILCSMCTVMCKHHCCISFQKDTGHRFRNTERLYSPNADPPYTLDGKSTLLCDLQGCIPCIVHMYSVVSTDLHNGTLHKPPFVRNRYYRRTRLECTPLERRPSSLQDICTLLGELRRGTRRFARIRLVFRRDFCNGYRHILRRMGSRCW